MNKTGLTKALEQVKPGLASKEQIEQSTHFAFKNGKVITYNDEISISHEVEGLDIEGAVEADKLYGLLNKISKEEIELWTEKNEVKVKAGKTKAGITLQKEIKLPINETPEHEEWEELPENFIQAVQFALFSCSKDMAKPVLTCVHVDGENGVVESSDGYRLTRYNLSEKMSIGKALIPHSSARELTKYNITHVAKNEGWVHFATDSGTVFSLRVLNGEYPDIEQFFEINGTKINLPKGMTEILQRAGVFSKRKFFLDEHVEVELQERKMNVKAQSDSGWINETANVSYKGEPVTFVTNPTFLADVCKETRQCELGEASMKFATDDWEHVIALSKK